MIAIGAVSIVTMAFITILSVSNGFNEVVQKLFNSFYADLEIVPTSGKTFVVSDSVFQKLEDIDGVMYYSKTLEDNALVEYDGKQGYAMIRGVDENFSKVTGLDTTVRVGNYVLYQNGSPQSIVGKGVSIIMGINPSFMETLKIYYPKRTGRYTNDVNKMINTKRTKPSGIYTTQPEIDSKYILVPFGFAANLFGYDNEISAIQVKVNEGFNIKDVQDRIVEIFGDDYLVKNRLQQNDLLYKTMHSEKLAIYLILAFVLIVASFNLVGSLTMLIIEKKNDIQSLRNLGCTMKTIRRIFLLEGLIISFTGALLGLLIGTAICWLQQKFHLIKLQGSGNFIIDAYPVDLQRTDILVVFIIVTFIGVVASWYPIRFITKRYIV